MMLITKAIDRELLGNHAANHDNDGLTLELTCDFKPVLKLFTPWGANTWLITERDTDNPDILYGLCDLGMQSPELGSVSLSELMSVKKMGLGVERDQWFEPDKTLSEYADAARAAGHIDA